MNIEDVSNPDVVLKRAKRLYGNDVQIYFSTHRDKKYMIINPITGKKIHLVRRFTKTIQSTETINGDNDFTKETINGKALIRILPHTHRIFYFGDGFNSNGLIKINIYRISLRLTTKYTHRLFL